jgi:DNA polymerase-1
MLGWGNYETALVDDYMETGILPDDATELYYYNGKDCVATFQLYHILKKKAEKDEVYDLYKTHYVPLMNALVDVELRGFEYDVIAAANLNEEIILPELRRLKDEMRAIVGQSLFNPASTLQVNSFVYDRCGLKHSLKSTRKRSFVRSFSDPVRTEITEGRFSCKSNYKESLIKFTELLDSFSEINKQRGTYIEGLIKLVKDDGRLYCSFNPCGTVTGRLSSRTPNFQNITRTERNVVPAIRTLFKPTAGSVLIQADYSQAELRCIARFSGDSELLSIYRDTARSLHRETASAFYGEHYTKEEYVKSKNINFGVCYGQSAFGFAQMYHMPEEEAQAYIDTWFAKFPQVRKWISQVHDQIKRDNYLTSPFGFKRRFHLLTRENLQEILKQGVNFLPQNTAGMLTAAALVRLNQLGVEVISTVHDSIIADVPYEDAMATAQCMKEVMESQAVISLGWDDIPFKVDISMSDSSWGEVEEVEVEIDY